MAGTPPGNDPNHLLLLVGPFGRHIPLVGPLEISGQVDRRVGPYVVDNRGLDHMDIVQKVGEILRV